MNQSNERSMRPQHPSLILSPRMGRGKTRLARWGMIVALLVGSVPALAEETDKPRPAGPAAGGSAGKSQVLTDAVNELTAEYKAAVKAKSLEDLRTSSDYFSQAPDDATPATVLAALEKPLGSDPRLNAYVKWQLLSAIQEPLPEDLASRAAKVYAKSPPLSPRPGISAGEKAELTRFASAAKEDDLPAVNEKYEQLLYRFDEANKLVLNYRDELLAKLPPTLETLEAGLKDGHERVAAGIDIASFWSTYSKVVTDWAGDKATAKECKRLAELMEKVGDQESAEYPDSVEWDPTAKRAKWRMTRMTLASPRERYEVINLLREKAGLQPANDDDDATDGPTVKKPRKMQPMDKKVPLERDSQQQEKKTGSSEKSDKSAKQQKEGKSE